MPFSWRERFCPRGTDQRTVGQLLIESGCFQNKGATKPLERSSIGHVDGEIDREGLDNGGREDRKVEAMTHFGQVKGIKLEGLSQPG